MMVIMRLIILLFQRDATAPRVDFAFNLSNGSIIYGGVNMAKHACLQVQMASSIEELERQGDY